MAVAPKVLDAGAAFGVAAFVVSVAGLLAQTAPDLPAVIDAGPGSGTARDVRVAELTAGAVVLGGGAVVGVLMRQWWPFLLTVTAVGGSIAIYEALLRMRPAEAG